MIHGYDWAKENIKDLGEVVKSDRSIVLVKGLKNATLGEAITFENGSHGMVTKIDSEYAEAMSFDNSPIPIGEKTARTGEKLKVSVGEGMLGDTFDCLGHITSVEKDPSEDSENRPIEVPAPTMEKRADVTKFFHTGVTIVDLVVPIAKGQRELVIGDTKTGKTTFLMQTVKTQAKLGTICILALIGKEQKEIAKIEQELEKAGVRNKCIIIAEPAKSSAARLTITPFTAMSVAEFFRDKGKDTLIVIDDLAYHAVRYREMALLSDKYPGRDSYPSDIFYLHARLLERAGSFLIDGKPVTITCLPVVTTVDGDITGYIQTNLMSMTDGHLYFDRNLFFDGIRPAVNIFLSVTRIGRQTQTHKAREWGQKILSAMTQYSELKRFLRFGAELGENVKESIRRAHGVMELLKQDESETINHEQQLERLEKMWGDKA